MRRTFALVMAGGLIWQAAVCFAIVPWWEMRANVAPAPDGYPVLARNLVETGTLGYAPYGASPTTVRGPAFAAWLAAGLVAGGGSPRWLAFWGGLPVVVVAALAAARLRRRYGWTAALAFAAVVLLHPLPAFATGRVMSDTFHAAWGWAAVMAWVAAEGRDGSARRLILLAASGCLAVHLLTRSSGLLALAAIGLAALAKERSRARQLLAVALVALLPAMLWSARTSRLEGRPVYVNSLLGYNFWLGEAQDRFGTGRSRSGQWRRGIQLVLEKARLTGKDPRTFWYGQLAPGEVAAMERALRDAALRHIVASPAAYLGRVARGLARFWIGAEAIRRKRQYVLAVIPVLLLAVAGVVAFLRQRIGMRDSLAPYALALIALHNVAYAAVFPSARFSVEIYPALGWLAAIGATALVRPPRPPRSQNDRSMPRRNDRPGSATRSFRNGSSASRCCE